MKHLILTLILGCSGLLTFSQTNNWAPVGAKWWYTVLNAESKAPGDTSFVVDYIYMESIGDTLINGTTFRSLEMIHYTYYGDTIHFPVRYIFENNGMVYLLYGGILYPIYNMNGDEWNPYTIYFINEQRFPFNNCPDKPSNTLLKGEYITFEKGNVTISGITLKKQGIAENILSYQETCGYRHSSRGGYSVIEGIGHEGFFWGAPSIDDRITDFDFYYWDSTAQPVVIGLNCYEDGKISYSNNYLSDVLVNVSCDSIGPIDNFVYQSINTIDNNSDVVLYPNPTRSKLNVIIESINTSDMYFEILSTEGKVMMKGKYRQVLDISPLSPGIYIYRLIVEDKIHVRKIISL